MCLNWNELLSPFWWAQIKTLETFRRSYVDTKKICIRCGTTENWIILDFVFIYSYYIWYFEFHCYNTTCQIIYKYAQFLYYLFNRFSLFIISKTFYCNLPIHYISLYVVPVCFFLGIKMDEAVDFNLRAFTTQQGSSV